MTERLVSTSPCPTCEETVGRVKTIYVSAFGVGLPVDADLCLGCGAIFVDRGESYAIYVEGRPKADGSSTI